MKPSVGRDGTTMSGERTSFDRYQDSRSWRAGVDRFQSEGRRRTGRMMPCRGHLAGRILRSQQVRHRLPDHQPRSPLRVQCRVTRSADGPGRGLDQPCAQHRHDRLTHPPHRPNGAARRSRRNWSQAGGPDRIRVRGALIGRDWTRAAFRSAFLTLAMAGLCFAFVPSSLFALIRARGTLSIH